MIGLVVTLGTFTPQAVSFARNKSNLRLIDGDKLVDLVIEHYDHHMRDATLASNAQSRELLSVGLRRNAALSPLTEKAARMKLSKD